MDDNLVLDLKLDLKILNNKDFLRDMLKYKLQNSKQTIIIYGCDKIQIRL